MRLRLLPHHSQVADAAEIEAVVAAETVIAADAAVETEIEDLASAVVEIEVGAAAEIEIEVPDERMLQVTIQLLKPQPQTLSQKRIVAAMTTAMLDFVPDDNR